RSARLPAAGMSGLVVIAGSSFLGMGMGARTYRICPPPHALDRHRLAGRLLYRDRFLPLGCDPATNALAGGGMTAFGWSRCSTAEQTSPSSWISRSKSRNGSLKSPDCPQLSPHEFEQSASARRVSTPRQRYA